MIKGTDNLIWTYRRRRNRDVLQYHLPKSTLRRRAGSCLTLPSKTTKQGLITYKCSGEKQRERARRVGRADVCGKHQIR